MAHQNLTIDELLALAEQTVESKMQLNYKEISQFCDEFNLSKGHDKVSFNVIYQSYYNWTRGTRIHPKMVSRLLKQKFKTKYQRRIGMFYFLNKKKLNIDLKPTTIMLANIFVKNLYEKENNKISEKKPSINK